MSGKGEQVGGTGLWGIFCFKSLISREISHPKLCWWKVIAIIYSWRSLTPGTNLWSTSELPIYWNLLAEYWSRFLGYIREIWACMLHLSFIKSSWLAPYFICSRRSWGTLIWVVKPWQHPEKQVFLSLGPGCRNQSVQGGEQTQSALAMRESSAWKGPQLCWSPASPRGLWDIQHDSAVQLWLNHSCNIQFGGLASRRKPGM